MPLLWSMRADKKYSISIPYFFFYKIFWNPITLVQRNQMHMVMMSMKPIWISLKYLGQILFITENIIQKLLIKLIVFMKNTISSKLYTRNVAYFGNNFAVCRCTTGFITSLDCASALNRKHGRSHFWVGGKPVARFTEISLR